MSEGLWDYITDGGGMKLFVDSLSSDIQPDDRKAIAEALKNWLANTARKKPVDDLNKRLEQWYKRFESLSERCKFTVREGVIVVNVAEADTSTLYALKNGSEWFDACNDVVTLMVSALIKV